MCSTSAIRLFQFRARTTRIRRVQAGRKMSSSRSTGLAASNSARLAGDRIDFCANYSTFAGGADPLPVAETRPGPTGVMQAHSAAQPHGGFRAIASPSHCLVGRAPASGRTNRRRARAPTAGSPDRWSTISMTHCRSIGAKYSSRVSVRHGSRSW